MTQTKKDAILLPQRAVMGCKATIRPVVSQDNKVEIRPIKVGEQVGNRWVIDQGLVAASRDRRASKAQGGMAVTPKSFNGRASSQR